MDVDTQKKQETGTAPANTGKSTTGEVMVANTTAETESTVQTLSNLIPPKLNVTVNFVGELGTLTMKFIPHVDISAAAVPASVLKDNEVVYGRYNETTWSVGKITDNGTRIIYENGETMAIKPENTRSIPDAVTICSIIFNKSKVSNNLATSSEIIRNILDIKYSFFSDLYTLLDAIITEDPNISITKSDTTVAVKITEKEKVKTLLDNTINLPILLKTSVDASKIDADISKYINDLLTKITSKDTAARFFDGGKKLEHYDISTSISGSDTVNLNSSKINSRGIYVINKIIDTKSIEDTSDFYKKQKLVDSSTISNLVQRFKAYQDKEPNNINYIRDKNIIEVKQESDETNTIYYLQLQHIRFSKYDIENTELPTDLSNNQIVLFKVDGISYWYPGQITEELKGSQPKQYIIKPFSSRFPTSIIQPIENIRSIAIDSNKIIKSDATATAPGDSDTGIGTASSGGNQLKKPRTKANRRYKKRTRKTKPQK